jgi:hypothetical protein
VADGVQHGRATMRNTGGEGGGAFCSGGRRRRMEQGGQDAEQGRSGPSQGRGGRRRGAGEVRRPGRGGRRRPEQERATGVGEDGRRWIHLGEMEKERKKTEIGKFTKKTLS